MSFVGLTKFVDAQLFKLSDDIAVLFQHMNGSILGGFKTEEASSVYFSRVAESARA